MKKTYFIILVLLMISQLSFALDCTVREYKKEDKKIYYIEGKLKKEIKTADYDTFEIIGSGPHIKLLAKDKRYVYYQGKRIENVNSKTFKIVKEELPSKKESQGYGCTSLGYIIEDRGKQYELKEIF